MKREYKLFLNKCDALKAEDSKKGKLLEKCMDYGEA
jgi:hypothetical protein